MGDTSLSGKSSQAQIVITTSPMGKRLCNTGIWIELTGSIIVTVLLGFLRVGRLTSILVFVYVFAANFFFLVSPPLSFNANR